MVNTNKTGDLEKLVQDIPLGSYDTEVPETTCTKKRAYRIRRVADPRLEQVKVKGRVYYRFRRGVDTPIYMGDAETVLHFFLLGKGKRC